MALESVPFSFPVFFATVFRDNTFVPNQYDVVNYLLFGYAFSDGHSGEIAVSDKTASQYALGTRPIAKIHRFNFLNLSLDVIQERMSLIQIRDPQKTADAFMSLINNGTISLSQENANKISEWYSADKTEAFLAKVLRLAVACNYTSNKPLSKIMIDALVEYRDHYVFYQENPKSSNSDPDQAGSSTVAIEAKEVLPDFDPVHALQNVAEQHKVLDSIFEPAYQSDPNAVPYADIVPGHPEITGAYYEVRRLNYEKEFQRLDKYYEDFEPFDPDMRIPQETISKCRYIFFHSKATFELKAVGYPSGIADAILSRVKRRSCMQLSFIVKLHGKSPLSKLCRVLRNIISYALADDGQVLFSYAQDDSVPHFQYAITCIYSVNDFSEDDEARQETIYEREQFPPSLDYKKYEGRIPAFFGPANAIPGGLTEQMDKWNRKAQK